nr:hypothetical protein 2 [bacterium]
MLKKVITTVGHQAAWDADQSGLVLKITHIGLGAGVNGAGYDPTPELTSLYDERVRIQVQEHKVEADHKTLVLAAVYQGELEFPVTEYGLYLEDGTLFMVASHPDYRNYKGTGGVFSIRFSLSLANSPDSVQPGGELNLNLTVMDSLTALTGGQASGFQMSLENRWRIDGLVNGSESLREENKRLTSQVESLRADVYFLLKINASLLGMLSNLERRLINGNG